MWRYSCDVVCVLIDFMVFCRAAAWYEESHDYERSRSSMSLHCTSVDFMVFRNCMNQSFVFVIVICIIVINSHCISKISWCFVIVTINHSWLYSNIHHDNHTHCISIHFIVFRNCNNKSFVIVTICMIVIIHNQLSFIPNSCPAHAQMDHVCQWCFSIFIKCNV